MTLAPPAPRVGRLLTRVAEGLATPFVPADYLDLFAPLRHGAELRGRIVAITPETADAATITIRPGRDWSGHRPGQYLRLGIDIDGVRRWRAYSLTSAPERCERGDGLLTITVKAIDDGLVSTYLVRRAQPGTLVRLEQACGDFVLPDALPERLLFMTGGSGITPVMGMLRSHRFDGCDIVVLHSAPTAADVIFAADLDALADAQAGATVRVITRLTDAEGMLAPADLEQVVPDWRERHAWVCGPTGMLDAFADHYDHAGLSEALHVERFRPSVIATGEGGTVTIESTTSAGTSVAIVDVDGATTILDAAEDEGVLMPSGCRMGICFGCVLPMTAGSVRDLRNGKLTETTPDDPPVMVQTCINAVAGSCTIERKDSFA